MAWSSAGLRGGTLEELINLTNDTYRSRGLALIQKIPTPITPVKMDSGSRTITLAYFDQKSTVDYIGVVQGVPVCFDAKETRQKNLPVQNIHEHQIEFMKEFQTHGGVSFLLVHFSLYGEYYFLPFDTLCHYYSESRAGGRKSIPYDAFDKGLIIPNKNGCYVHYLEPLSEFLRRGEYEERV